MELVPGWTINSDGTESTSLERFRRELEGACASTVTSSFASALLTSSQACVWGREGLLILSSSITCTYATIVIPTSAVSLTVAIALVISLMSEMFRGGFGLRIVSPGEAEKITFEGGSFAFNTWISNSLSHDSPPLSLHMSVMLWDACFS